VVIMSVETDRLKAAQAKADEIIRAVGETPDGDLLLRIAVTDTVTGQRMATGFANYAVGDGPQPELAGERDLLRAVLEALDVPFSVPEYERRVEERAVNVRSALKGYLGEGDPGWHAAWLRDRTRAEEARHQGGAS
jgi:hypothetical protein